MSRRWATGRDDSFMQSPVIHVHITGMVHVHNLGLMPIDSLLDVFDQIEAIN